MLGYNACKFYHGDLIERSMCLVLAASGNWGKHGTGIRCWAAGMHDGQAIAMAKPGPGAANTRDRPLRPRCRHRRDEGDRPDDDHRDGHPRDGEDDAPGGARRHQPGRPERRWQAAQQRRRPSGGTGRPATRSAGTRRSGATRRCRAASTSTSTRRSTRAGGRGSTSHGRRSRPACSSSAAATCCAAPAAARRRLLADLWPKLKTIVTIDFRMSQTALYADYFLPAAQHYEKITFGMPDAARPQPHARRQGGGAPRRGQGRVGHLRRAR